MRRRSAVTALAISCTLLAAAAASAQTSSGGSLEPLRRPPAMDSAPAPEPRRLSYPTTSDPLDAGLVHVIPLAENARIGVGRFAISEIARPRTHMERPRHTDMGSKQRGMAAVGFRLSF